MVSQNAGSSAPSEPNTSSVETWRKHAQRDISFREFKQQALTLDRRDGPHDGGLPEGKATFLRWCDEMEKLKVAKVEFLEGTCTDSDWNNREIHLSIGDVDVLETKHKWSMKSEGRRVFDYKNSKEFKTVSRWMPGDRISFKLEGDRNQLKFLGLAADPNIIVEELGGPVSLWRLRVRGFFWSKGEDGETKVTVRVPCPAGPPNSLSRTDIAIGKDLLGLE